MKRRDFLKASAVGGAAAAAAATVTTKVRRASAIPMFGDTPADHASIMIPKANQASNILECFLYGGVTPWEGFYCNPEFGSETGRTWHKAYPTDFANAAIACGIDNQNPFTFFAKAQGADGRDIFLSPFLKPLLARQDVVDRMRVVVNRHTLEPHEAAIPLTMSGKTLGSPSLASLGAHVARYFVDRDVDNLHPAPYAYGFSTGIFAANDNILSMLATGLHPGSVRPLHIKIDNAARLATLLDRLKVGDSSDRERYDLLMATYTSQYNARLKFGASDMLRAPRLAELTAAANAVAHVTDIKQLLSSDYLTKFSSQACTVRGGTGNAPNQSAVTNTPLFNDLPTTVSRAVAGNFPAMSLKMATHLLTDPTGGAKHCMVVDTGLREADGGGGYDTHSETPFTQSRNLYNFFANGLLPMINAPGETDPNKLDLNKTMIILNMEFGRTPGLQNTTNTGRNHWPYGYTQVYIGGPITNAQKGVYGVIPESGQASVFTNPTENRIAGLLAMGIWPFDASSFSSAGVTEDGIAAGSESLAVRSVLKRVLGYTV